MLGCGDPSACRCGYAYFPPPCHLPDKCCRGDPLTEELKQGCCQVNRIDSGDSDGSPGEPFPGCEDEDDAPTPTGRKDKHFFISEATSYNSNQPSDILNHACLDDALAPLGGKLKNQLKSLGWTADWRNDGQPDGNGQSSPTDFRERTVDRGANTGEVAVFSGHGLTSYRGIFWTHPDRDTEDCAALFGEAEDRDPQNDELITLGGVDGARAAVLASSCTGYDPSLTAAVDPLDAALQDYRGTLGRSQLWMIFTFVDSPKLNADVLANWVQGMKSVSRYPIYFPNGDPISASHSWQENLWATPSTDPIDPMEGFVNQPIVYTNGAPGELLEDVYDRAVGANIMEGTYRLDEDFIGPPPAEGAPVYAYWWQNEDTEGDGWWSEGLHGRPDPIPADNDCSPHF